jgi:hypothetical protein
VLRIVAVLSVMLLAVGCGGHDCKAYNEAICDRAGACGYTGCDVNTCPGYEKVDFSQCIDAARKSACGDLEATVRGCRVVPG